MSNKNNNRRTPQSPAKRDSGIATPPAPPADAIKEELPLEEAVAPVEENPVEVKPKKQAPKFQQETAPEKEKTVMVEFIKVIAGIKPGHKKQLPISLAKNMEKKGKVKIV